MGPRGATPKRGNFHRLWKQALEGAEIGADLHLHDLRHTGGTMTARTGAALKEIMSRLGQSSPRAAIIYQHATSERDRKIAKRWTAATARSPNNRAKPAPTRVRHWRRSPDLAHEGISGFKSRMPGSGEQPSELVLSAWSGRPGSNRHGQLGRLCPLRRQRHQSMVRPGHE
ncbi:MAG: tyrosine-type recombinase/integrase [Pseudonocardiaceae bacterium]